MSSRGYRALLIANSTYPNDTHNLPDLEGPRNDPALLRDALCDDRYGLFPTDSVRLVAERTMAEVLREAEEFLRSANRQDTLLLYYSGHGKLDLSGELYLCTRDTRADRLRSTAVKASDLSAMIEESAAATTVILLDCCHSGAFKGGELAQTLAGRGRFVVTSCRTGELANDSHALNRASMFTHHVVEGMLGAAPDHDGDGLVGLNDLYGYVHGRLAAEQRQIPQRSFAGTGDVPVARRPEATMSGTALPVSPDAGAADPVLDVSETLIDLGQVALDEDLPAERVAVINRGGGELHWTAECSADWVTLVRDEYGLLLHLHPGPGTNRANVHVRDDRTGMVKTVRLIVRTEPDHVSVAAAPVAAGRSPAQASSASTPATEVRPSEAPPTEAPTPATTAAGPGRAMLWFGLALAAAVVTGVWLARSGIQFHDDYRNQTGAEQVLVRNWDYGPGLGTSILGGLALIGVAATAVVVFARRRTVPAPWRRLLLGVGASLAACLAVERANTSLRWAYEWFFDEWISSFGINAVLLGLATTGLCWVALRADRAWVRRARWDPPWLLPVGVGSALLWGAGSMVPLHTDAYVQSYFDDTCSCDDWTAEVTIAMVLLVAVLAATVVVATRWLSADAGRGLLLGAATFVVLVEVTEVAAFLRTSEHRPGFGVLWMLLPAATYVGAIVVALRPRSA